MGDLKRKVVKGFAWAFLERFSTQFAGFFVSLILARLLTPSDYGTVALLTIFIALSAVIADSGFGQALIQKKDATELDFNSVFYLSLGLSIVVYLLLFLGAPFIADFYDDDRLTPILRVLALTVVLNAINSIQIAELNRRLLFHLSFRVGILTSIATAIVGVTLAYLGYGPWALVWSAVAGAVVGVFARWFFIAWRPRLIFSWSNVVGLFRFGWKMTVSSLLDVGYNNLYGLLIGKLYSRADLAFVEKGQVVPKIATDTFNSTLGNVAFPALSQLQDQPDVVRKAMRRMISLGTFFVFPLMAGFAIVAPELIQLLYGEQWLPAVPYLRLACFSFALWPFHTVNLKALVAIGRSDLFLGLELIKKGIGLALMLTAIRYGVWWMMAISAFVGGPLSLVVNSWPSRRLLHYTLPMQVHDVSRTIVATVFCSVIIYLSSVTGWPAVLRLSFGGIAGGLFYLLAAWLLRLEPLREIAFILTPTVQRRFQSRLIQSAWGIFLSRFADDGRGGQPSCEGR